jgi:hypothetical protein
LRNLKMGKSYKIYKEKGVWGIEAIDKKNQKVLLPLDNEKVISKIEKEMK